MDNKKLKIKNNVNLSDLLLYGFEIDENDWYVYNLNEQCDVIVKPISRHLFIKAYSRHYIAYLELDIIYKLIKADLVEVDE